MSNNRSLYKKLVAEKNKRLDDSNLENGLYIFPNGSVVNVVDGVQTILGESGDISGGVVIPNVTTLERDALTEASDGLVVFNTDTDELHMYTTDGSQGAWAYIEHRVCYAHAWVEDQNTTLTPTTGDVSEYTKIVTGASTGFSTTFIRNFDQNSVDGSLTYTGPDASGTPVYIDAKIVCTSGAGGTDEYRINVFKNGSPITIPTIFSTRGVNNVNSESLFAVTSLSTGDVIDVRVSGDNTEGLVVQYADFVIR